VTVPITLAANATSWDERRNRLIPGGQGDRYLSPILAHLPDTAVISRQPRPASVNFYMNHRDRYQRGCWRGEHASVQGSHGLASKGYRDAAICVDFTHVAAPGPALAEEIARSGVPRSKIRILGYAKLDPIHNGEVASPWPERDGRIRVLWAPTHGGGSEAHRAGNPDAPGAAATTWWHRDALLSLLDSDRFLVMEAPHPRHSPRRQATLGQYVAADVVIADGGSTMYEAWCVGLPVVFADWLTAARNLTRADGRLLEHRVYAQQIGWHALAAGELADAVGDAARLGISPAEVAFAEEVIPTEYRGSGGKRHAEFLLELADGPPRRLLVRPVTSEVPVKFVSAKYPTLDLSNKPGLHGVRFVDGFCEVSRPNAISILQSPWWQRRGVRIATDEDLRVLPPGRAATAEPAVAEVPATVPDLPQDSQLDGDVPQGNAEEVLAWVGDDPDRARQALDAEQARDKPRTGVAAKLTKLAGAAPAPTEVPA
jgi:hypothetical protein